jgi:hypothetical protein
MMLFRSCSIILDMASSKFIGVAGWLAAKWVLPASALESVLVIGKITSPRVSFLVERHQGIVGQKALQPGLHIPLCPLEDILG